jgi:hypothetical protein
MNPEYQYLPASAQFTDPKPQGSVGNRKNEALELVIFCTAGLTRANPMHWLVRRICPSQGS